MKTVSSHYCEASKHSSVYSPLHKIITHRYLLRVCSELMVHGIIWYYLISNIFIDICNLIMLLATYVALLLYTARVIKLHKWPLYSGFSMQNAPLLCCPNTLRPGQHDCHFAKTFSWTVFKGNLTIWFHRSELPLIGFLMIQLICQHCFC